MRLNQFLAQATGLSRRRADSAIEQGQVSVNDALAELGQQVDPDRDRIKYAGLAIRTTTSAAIMLNKPAGYVTSRAGQNSPTIYNLLPESLQRLKPAGRLDKDSSGLLVLSSDGDLIQRLSHPSQGKVKRYQVELDRPINSTDLDRLQRGVELEEGTSQISVRSHQDTKLELGLVTGWNRQIRRTLAALGYRITKLHRTAIGNLVLGELKSGEWRVLKPEEIE